MSVLHIETVTVSGRAAVLLLHGTLDVATADQLVPRVREVLADRPARVIVDCRECRFVDTGGLGALVTALRAAREAGVDLRLASVGDRLRLLLERTNLFRVLREVAPPDLPGRDAARPSPATPLRAGNG